MADSDSDIYGDGRSGFDSNIYGDIGRGNDSDNDSDNDRGEDDDSDDGNDSDQDNDGDNDGDNDNDSDSDSDSGIEQRLIEFLADLLDNEGDWTWGCNNTTESGCIRHHRDLTPLPNQQRVGPREWGEARLQHLFADDGAVLPDYLKADVLPREAGGTLSYQEVTDNMKKQARLPFTHTERREWLSNHGPAFKKMMTGDFGNGVQHLQFDIEDLGQQMEPQCRGKSSLFQTNDIDSGMGWLPNLGAIKTDIRFFLYPYSSRNFDANLHLFMKIDGHNVKIHDINHFLLGEFGNIGGRSCQLFLFLPGLYNPQSKGNGVRDHLKDAFISRCFIPAVEKVFGEESLGQFLLEQFAKGMREAKTDCEAPTREGQIYGPAGNRLAGDVHIRQTFLKRIWEDCMSRLDDLVRAKDEDLISFKDCRLFWSFKGFKYALAERDDEELEWTIESKVNIPHHRGLTIFSGERHVRYVTD
jgi:hypothetical protein